MVRVVSAPLFGFYVSLSGKQKYEMFDLNLPRYAHKMRLKDGKRQIYDRLRKKFVALTPEEWVRQNFTQFLLETKGFPSGRTVHEATLNQHGRTKRCDTVVYDDRMQPLVIVEYKAPGVVLTEKTFQQIATYNWALRVRYLIVSNGLSHYCCRVNYEDQRVDFLGEIPDYAEMVTENDRSSQDGQS
jgi:hypothetical protein